MRDSFKKLRATLDQREQELLQTIVEAKSQKEKELGFQKEDLEFSHLAIRDSTQFASVLLGEGTTVEIALEVVPVGTRLRSSRLCGRLSRRAAGGELRHL